MTEPLLSMQHVSKSFPGVRALDDVSLNVYPGEVMALLGENGAGKSTLMKVLTGVYAADSGTLLYDGQQTWFSSPRASQEAGIAIIHQELNLLPELTIAENIFLGREPTNALGKILWQQLYEQAEALLTRLGVRHSPRKRVRELGIGDQQMVEIAKALSFDARVIVMDEPTDALTEPETKALFKVIKELRANGCGVVYISHRLAEVFLVCDRATVLRDGQFIDEFKVSDVNEDVLIERMVGRKLEHQYPHVEVSPGEPVLAVENLSGPEFEDVSFNCRSSEILGVSGLIGAGRTEVMRAISGAVKITAGTVSVKGVPLRLRNPRDALRAGIAYISEDRKGDGLVMGLSVRHNMTLASLRELSSGWQIRHGQEELKVAEYIDAFRIKTPRQTQLMLNLSGGNQQKVTIAKGLMTQPRILILDEPTRGVDVGAKKEIYQLINTLKKKGLAIILVSSDMPEVLGMSDRILVMHEGRIVAEESRANATQEKLLTHAVGSDLSEVTL